LALVSRLLNRQELREKLLTARTPEQALAFFRESESA